MSIAHLEQHWLVPPTSEGNPLAYAPRQCVSLGRGMAQGIGYKAYAMWSDRFSMADLPTKAQITKAISVGLTGWDAPADHPAAFAILHLANDGIYLLLTRWNNANNLRHRVFSVELQGVDGMSLQHLSDPFTIACVWETRLICIEANAWIEEVLAAPGDQLSAHMLDCYLNRQFEGLL